MQQYYSLQTSWRRKSIWSSRHLNKEGELTSQFDTRYPCSITHIRETTSGFQTTAWAPFKPFSFVWDIGKTIEHLMDSWITSTLKLIYKGKALLTLIFFTFPLRKNPLNIDLWNLVTTVTFIIATTRFLVAQCLYTSDSCFVKKSRQLPQTTRMLSTVNNCLAFNFLHNNNFHTWT